VFLLLALAGSAVVAVLLARDGRLAAAALAAGAVIYFALRAFAGLGGRTR
jgi:hypothetical protein